MRDAAAPLPDVTTNPTTLADLCAELRRVHAESVEYWSGYDTGAFFAPMGAAWSPAEHVRHLTKSIRPVTRGLGLPRLALRVLFGRARAPSRSYDAMRDVYRAALADGIGAGRFTPSRRDAGGDPDGERARIMRAHAGAVEALARTAGQWPDDALDRVALPHPRLGTLTCREMLCFTLYHDVHHVHVAERRRREARG